ncbi:MAG: RNA-binding cell elongation regulator Jag/EloR [Fastidiosipilaceae bacterium]|jgi:spoIIIJ-associated protein
MLNGIEKTGKTVSDAVQAALDELDVSLDDVLVEVLDEGGTGGLLGFGRKPARVLVTLNSAILEKERSEVEEALPEEPIVETGEPIVETVEPIELLENKVPAEAADEDDLVAAEPSVDESQVELDEEIVYYGDDVDVADPADHTKEEEAAIDFLRRVFDFFDVRETIDTSWEDGRLLIDVNGENCGQVIGHRGETLNALQYLTSIAVNRVTNSHVHVTLDISGYRARREGALRRTANRYASEVVQRQKEFVMEPMNAAERRVVHFALQNYPGVTTESEGDEPNRCVVIIPTQDQ